jgi:hypothetical protein
MSSEQGEATTAFHPFRWEDAEDPFEALKGLPSPMPDLGAIVPAAALGQALHPLRRSGDGLSRLADVQQHRRLH